MSNFQLALIGGGGGLVIGLLFALYVIRFVIGPAVVRSGGDRRGVRLLTVYFSAVCPIVMAAAGAFYTTYVYGGRV